MGNAQPAGKVTSNQPNFLVLGDETPAVPNHHKPYQLRLYQTYFTADIAGRPGSSANEKFSALAGYIGVFSIGGGANSKRMSMGMTSPVLTAYPMSDAMRRAEAPDLAGTVFMSSAGGEIMSFILPFRFSRIEDVPQPNDRRITIHAVPNQVIAAVRFSGIYTTAMGKQHLHELGRHLLADGLISETDELQWRAAQYDSPFVPAGKRRNEGNTLPFRTNDSYSDPFPCVSMCWTSSSISIETHTSSLCSSLFITA